MTNTNTPGSTTLPSADNSTTPFSQKTLLYALLGILGVALGLRLWGISFGLPYDFTPDEVHEIVRALKLGAGEYSWTMGKGGLYYFLFVEYGFLYVFWWVTGQVSGPNDFAIMYLQDPSAFYLAGRITVAIMGTLTCLVVFLIGKRIYDWRIGLAAALIGATAHYHGMWSHYINVDIGMTLAVWASILTYILFEQNNQTRWLIAAGILGGIAFAFKLPGAVVALPLLLAGISASGLQMPGRQTVKHAAIVLIAMLISATIVAPENIVGIGSVLGNFTSVLSNPNNQELGNVVLGNAVKEITVYRGSVSYFSILVRDTNVVLSVFVLAGIGFGFWKRNRWDIIFFVLIAAFIGVMTAADRPGNERYLLPVVPALWLLGARGAVAIAGKRDGLLIALLGCITAIPLATLAKQNHTWTLPDSRVLAKEWIEANVPSGSKILMDGMRYRFIQSPPLNPDQSTVDRRVGGASEEGKLSRGVSSRTLELYSKAMNKIEGPKYDLHSTVWGLDVQELSYYPQACFDYIVTSSDVSRRFKPGDNGSEHAKSVDFYRQLPIDPLFSAVYSAIPASGKVQGPEINVYKVATTCD